MKGQIRKNAFGKGFISDVILKLRLTMHLIKDERVPVWLKLIPLFCLVYLIIPVDLLFGPIDDAVILYFGMDFFIDLCPPEVVSEYLEKLTGTSDSTENQEIIDVNFKEK